MAVADSTNSRYRTGTWYLYYWPGFRGRGDFARLMFDVAGVRYVDVSNEEKSAEKVLKYYNCDLDPSFPVLAPPIIKHTMPKREQQQLEQQENQGDQGNPGDQGNQGKPGNQENVAIPMEQLRHGGQGEQGGPSQQRPQDVQTGGQGGQGEGEEVEDFILCQTVAILLFLGTEFGLCPEKPEDMAHAHQVALTVADYIAEGHDAHHPIKKTGTYDSQKEEAKPFINYFRTVRLPRYMDHLEKVYKKQKSEDCKYFFRSKNREGGELQPTFADIAVYHALRATEGTFPDFKEEIRQKYPNLLNFMELMDGHPGIQRFKTSTEKLKFCGNSMM